jgi:hypothetical protein
MLNWLLACLMLSMFFATTARAEVRALLIGVSDYAEETGIHDLKGPRNDVLLMRDVLRKRGVDDILVLADGVDDAARPKLAAIEAAFAAITRRAQRGDLVYLHMSGHGTRQHDLNGDEADGLDEVFLPADVEIAGPGGKVIPNALTDDRIGQLIEEIRATGADVWLVMDSCHAGSGMRNLTSMIAVRHVDPQTLGIEPGSATPEASAIDTQTAERIEGKGRYLAFYATRANDVAREGDLARGSVSMGEGDNAWFGLFSSAIAVRLDAGQPLSYRQLFQAVLSDLNQGSGFGAAAVQTPLWEGDMIDAPVFGGEMLPGLRRFLVEGDAVQAGLVHGLREGTLLALVSDIADAANHVLSYAQVEEVEARRAYIRPVGRDCVPDSGALCSRSGALPPNARFAQIEMQPVDHVIRFSPIVDAASGAPIATDDTLAQSFNDAIERASELTGLPAEINPDGYEIAVRYQGDSLWFGPVTAIGESPAGLEVAHAMDIEMRDLALVVMRILRAEQLAQSLEQLSGEPSFANPSPVRIEAGRFASDLAQLARPGERIDPRLECGPVYEAAMAGEFAPIDPVEEVKQCDILRFAGEGTSNRRIDVNRIYIDAQYCIHADYELIDGENARRSLGDELVICSDCPGEVPYSAGVERMYFLMSEQEENAEALNLSGLVENCIGAGAATGSRSVQRERLGALMNEIVQAGGTRGMMGLSMSSMASGVWVEAYRWQVLPRAELFRRASLAPQK